MAASEGDSQNVLLFRVSICVLLMGLEVLCCLAGKLVRERSHKGFSYFYSFCGGILLSRGLFCGIFDNVGSADARAAQYSLSLFSLSLVLLIGLQMGGKSGAYEYKAVALSPEDDADVDDEERLGIELGMLPAAADDDDNDFDDDAEDPHIRRRQAKHVNARDEIASSPSRGHTPSERVLWSLCVVSLVVLAEGATGALVGTAEHEALGAYAKVFLQGTLLALACGAVLEESVRSPMEYVRAIALVATALPLGMVSGSCAIAWLGVEPTQLAAYAATVSPVAAGGYTAAAVLHLLPTSIHRHGAGGDDEGTFVGPARRLVTPSRLRAACFAMGYLVTATSARLP